MDFGKEGTGDFVERIKLNVNEDTRSLAANRNFLSLVQGNAGRSFRGYCFGYCRDQTIINWGCPPVINVPSEREKIKVSKWSVKYVDIYQSVEDENYFAFSVFVINLRNENRSTTQPKLGSIVNKIEILEPGFLYKLIDCGIITD